MKKSIFMLLCIIGVYSICDAVMQSPQLYLMKINIQSESNWSIKIHPHALYDSSYFDSVSIETSKNRTVYDISHKTKAEKAMMILREFIITNDSLSKKINIDPTGDKIVITMYIANKTFKLSENKDSVTFGSYPDATFDALTPIASIHRSKICGGIFPLKYDSGIPCNFTLKGIIYDLNGIPVTNTSFAEEVYWNYTGPDFCYANAINTNESGEFQTTKTCIDMKYQTSTIVLYGSTPKYISITPINIRAVNDTIINCDIHLRNSIVSDTEIWKDTINIFPNPASSEFTLNYSLQNTEDAFIEIGSIQGTIIERIPLKNSSSSIIIKLDKKYIPNMYYVRLFSGKRLVAVKKLVVKK